MINVVSKKLSNGADCYIVPKKGYKEKICMIAFKYGSCNNKYDIDGKSIIHPYGIAHFLEHKMFEDKSINIFETFSKLGLSANAFTNFDTTAYYFKGCDNFEKGLALLCRMVGSLYLTDDNIKKEKDIINQEINMYDDDPYWQLFFNTLKGCYKDNPCREGVAGSIKSVSQITKEMLFEGYNDFYTGDNCIMVVVGDVDCQKVFEEAEKELILNTAKPQRAEYKDNYLNKKIRLNMDIDTPIYNIAFKQNIEEKLIDRVCVNGLILSVLTAKSSYLRQKLLNKGLINDYFGNENLVGLDYGVSIISGQGNTYDAVADEVLNYISECTATLNEDYISRLANVEKTKMLFGMQNIEYIANNIVDFSSKGIEVLDIYNNYGKISVEKILKYTTDYYSSDNMVISVVEK